MTKVSIRFRPGERVYRNFCGVMFERDGMCRRPVPERRALKILASRQGRLHLELAPDPSEVLVGTPAEEPPPLAEPEPVKDYMVDEVAEPEPEAEPEPVSEFELEPKSAGKPRSKRRGRSR